MSGADRGPRGVLAGLEDAWPRARRAAARTLLGRLAEVSMSVLLPLLLACTGADPSDTSEPAGEDTATPSGTTWAGSLGGEALSGAPTAVWAAVGAGAARAFGPSGHVAEQAIVGVDLDASVVVWLTDAPDACAALATYETNAVAASMAMVQGDRDAAITALTAATGAVPERFASLAFGLAAEDAAGLTGEWDLAPDGSEEGAHGWHAATFVGERQVEAPDWSAIFGGSGSLEDAFATGGLRAGTAVTGGLDGGRLVVDVSATTEEGSALTVHAEAARCEALEAALAPLHGEPSAVE